MKNKLFKLINTIIILSLLMSLNIVNAIQLIGTPDDTNGVTLYSAGLSAGTPGEPTGEPGGEPTDEVVDEAVQDGILEYIGDIAAEVIDFESGPPEPYENGRDTTLAGVTEGLEEIDDFGLIEEGNDPSANYDAGIGGWVRLGDFGRIRADGVINNNTLGFDPGLTPEEQLNGNEIFIFEDAELSGMIISLKTLNGDTINITIADRQIDPNTEEGADDTLITIDLDSLPGFDKVNDAVVEILIVDDGISMSGSPAPDPVLPIWGDSTLELDAVAVLVTALTGEINGYKWNDLDGDGAWDVDEPALEGWTIDLSGDSVDSTLTDSSGFYKFTDLPAGNYMVSEIVKSSWVQTHPSGTGNHDISLSPGETSTNNNFGNQYIPPPPSVGGDAETIMGTSNYEEITVAALSIALIAIVVIKLYKN
jgi:hypothetical protein